MEDAQRIVAWDDGGRLADDEWLVERNETAIIAICRALLSSPRVEGEKLKKAAQLALDQTSDDPAPGTWNDACEHIAGLLSALSPQVE